MVRSVWLSTQAQPPVPYSSKLLMTYPTRPLPVPKASVFTLLLAQPLALQPVTFVLAVDPDPSNSTPNNQFGVNSQL